MPLHVLARAGRRMAAAGLGVVVVVSSAHARQSTELMYVCVQAEAKIAVVDVQKQSVVRTIDLTTLGFSANAKPHHIVVEPDGSFWYVTLIGDNVVLKFDRNDEIVGRYQTEVPGLLALHPSQNLMTVGRSMSAVNAPQRIAVLDRTTLQGDEIELLVPRPRS